MRLKSVAQATSPSAAANNEPEVLPSASSPEFLRFAQQFAPGLVEALGLKTPPSITSKIYERYSPTPATDAILREALGGTTASFLRQTFPACRLEVDLADGATTGEFKVIDGVRQFASIPFTTTADGVVTVTGERTPQAVLAPAATDSEQQIVGKAMGREIVKLAETDLVKAAGIFRHYRKVVHGPETYRATREYIITHAPQIVRALGLEKEKQVTMTDLLNRRYFSSNEQRLAFVASAMDKTFAEVMMSWPEGKPDTMVEFEPYTPGKPTSGRVVWVQVVNKVWRHVAATHFAADTAGNIVSAQLC